MFIYISRFLLFSFILLCTNFFSQAKFTSKNAIGDWDGGTSDWTITGTDADNIPDENDTVEIQVGHNINTLSTQSTRICKIINNGEIILNTTYPLYVYGNGTTSQNNGVISGSGIYWQVRSGTLQGSGTMPNAKLNISFQNLFIDKDLTINNEIALASGGDLFINSGRTLTINDVIKASSGTSVTNNGTVIVNTSSFFTLNEPSTNVFFSSSGNIVWNTSLAFSVPADGGYNDVTINSSTSLDGNLNIIGDLQNNSSSPGFSFSSGNILTFNGSAAQEISGSGINNIYNLTLNNASGLSLGMGIVQGVLNINECMQTLNGAFTQNGITINLKSSSENEAGVIKINNETDFIRTSGGFVCERYFNASNHGWRMIGAPIENTSLNDWDDEFIYCGFAGADYSYAFCNNFCSVWFYDETQATLGNKNDGLDSATNITNSVSPDNAALIYGSSGATTLSVSGIPEFDDISFNVTRQGADNAFGWNLISNPYPATLDWTNGSSGFYDDNSSVIDNAHYIFNSSSGNYVSSTNDIPHSQGFWVKKTNTGSSNLNFSVSQTSSEYTTSFTKSLNGINNPLKLVLTNEANSYYDVCYLMSSPYYSHNYEPGIDIYKFLTPDPYNVPNIYFEDSVGRMLDRNCVNSNNSGQFYFDVIPGIFSQGNHTITFQNSPQFMIGSCLILEDLETGIITDLRTDSSYTFYHDTSSLSPRFKINITLDYNINVNNSTCFQDSSGSIIVFGNGVSGDYFSLYNDGLIIDSSYFINDTLIIGGLSAGIYNFSTSDTGFCSVGNQEIIILEPNQVIADFSFLKDTIDITATGNVKVYFKNQSVGATSYSWDFGNGDTSNVESPYANYNNYGTYDIQLKAFNDSLCEDIINKQIVIISNNITTIETNLINQSNLILIDNKIDLRDYKGNFKQINIYDLNGRLVLTKRRFESLLDINKVDSGIYLVEIFDKDNLVHSHKISKTK